MPTRVARHAHRSVGLRSPLLLASVLWATAGQWADGLTRFLMPDRFELNRLSAFLGGGGSLLVKAGLVTFLLVVAHSLVARGRPRRAAALLLFAGAVGFWGASTNLAVLGAL